MPRAKRRYDVFLVGHGEGCYAKNHSKHYMGETWAVSKKQAVNNIHYRIRQNGEELPICLGDAMEFGIVTYTLEAFEV